MDLDRFCQPKDEAQSEKAKFDSCGQNTADQESAPGVLTKAIARENVFLHEAFQDAIHRSEAGAGAGKLRFTTGWRNENGT